MAKLRVLSGRQICEILSAHGFVAARQRGSHIMMRKKLPTRTLTVPVPNHRTVAIGTLREIITRSRLPRSEFE